MASHDVASIIRWSLALGAKSTLDAQTRFGASFTRRSPADLEEGGVGGVVNDIEPPEGVDSPPRLSRSDSRHPRHSSNVIKFGSIVHAARFVQSAERLSRGAADGGKMDNKVWPRTSVAE